MPVKVTIVNDVFADPATHKVAEVESLVDYLVSRFPSWPNTARIYNEAVAQICDVTPNNEAEVDRLHTLKGPFTIIVYPSQNQALDAPGEFATIIIAIVAIIAVVAAVFLLRPKTPNPNVKQPDGSPNNSIATLGGRSNTARPNGRINDIAGTVFCIFDMLMVPWRFFKDNIEYEVGYFCCGRGQYEFANNIIYDGDTPVGNIPGSSCEVYGPNTSPNSGDAPVLTIGDPIGLRVITIRRSNSVDGQEIFPRNYRVAESWAALEFVYPNIIRYTGSEDNYMARYFRQGDDVTVYSLDYTNGAVTANLSGLYTISLISTFGSVSGNQIELGDAASVNADWNKLSDFPGQATTDQQRVAIDGTGGLFNYGMDRIPVGYFVLYCPLMSGIKLNLVAEQGCYYIDNATGEQHYIDVDFRIRVQPCDALGNAVGPFVEYSKTFFGSSSQKSQLALSLSIGATSTTNYIKVQIIRDTDRDYNTGHSVTDIILWRDLYVFSSHVPSRFGNITSILSVTRATATALAVKDRKLSAVVTRQFPKYLGNNTFSVTLYSTNDAADIISAFALDPYIGNRQVSEADFDNLYDTTAAIAAYFDFDGCKEFCYTFDDPDLSFEDTIATIAQAIFCNAYRQGSQLKLSFERLTVDSKLLFNHRNKVPGSETRQVSFGNQNNYDGVSITYVDPNNNDAPATLYFPADQSAKNPNEIQTTGVRNNIQAYMRGAREYNKILYQHLTTQFTGLQMADLLITADRFLATDNTRPDVQDGDINAVSGLTLTLSQNISLSGLTTPVIFLQHYDETVESIGVSSGANPNQVVLAAAPRLPLAVDDALYAKSKFEIVGGNQRGQRAFLLTGRTPQDNGTSDLTAVNYDDRYYGNDSDYANGVIDAEGGIIDLNSDLPVVANLW